MLQGTELWKDCVGLVIRIHLLPLAKFQWKEARMQNVKDD